jgi:hypothetical protein
MKTKFLSILYKIFAFLADKTNGWKMFVKPKLMLGALLVGISATVSLTSCKTNQPTCYMPPPPPEVLCYDAGPTDPNDTTTVEQPQITENEPN